MTRPVNVTWRSGTTPEEWQTRVGVSTFKKWNWRMRSNYRGIAGVLERRLRLIVKPRIQEEQWGFVSDRGTVDQIFILTKLLRGSWELTFQSACVLGTWKRLITLFAWDSVKGAVEVGDQNPFYE